MARVRNRKRATKTKAEVTVSKTLTKNVELVQLSKVKFDKRVFESMSGGKAIDKLFSNQGGIPRATNYIVIGDPGVGKSTVCLDIISDIKKQKEKVLFISGEMSRVDMYQYMQRYPKFGNIDILFLGEYTDENCKLVVEQVLDRGYDIVLGDSFVEIQDAVKETAGMTTGSAEKWLIDLMLKHNNGENKGNSYTSFLMIQQVTKGGNFVGSNKLKHNTTGMLEIRFTEEGGQERYLMFTKNRRGDVYKKMYFSLAAEGDVLYHAERFIQEEENRKRLDQEMEELKKDADAWDKIFANTEEEAIAENAEVDEEQI
jgi:predicted ATP-dependent serine protease